MCAGVVVILAVLKFSTSPSKLGVKVSSALNVIMINSSGVVSLIMK